MDSKIYAHRREKVSEYIEVGSIVVLFAGDLIKRSADASYPFSVNRNFHYLTGLDEDSLILVLANTNQGKREWLFIKDFNPTTEKWVGKSIYKDEATAISGISTVFSLSQFDSFFSKNLMRMGITSLFIDGERDDFKSRIMEGEQFGHKCKQHYPALTILNIYPHICAMRTIKNSQEVDEVRKAIDITQKGIERMMKEMKPGMTEYEIVAHFDYELAKANAGYAFDTIAASGPEATTLHYVKNTRTVLDHELVLFDLGASHNLYSADISRTIPVNGKFTARQKVFYEIVLKAQLAVIEAIKPGVTFVSLNDIVKEVYATECVKAKIIAKPEEVEDVYYHSVSHLLGLDTHDVGQLEAMVLKPGNIITVEPGLYSSKEGIGIRIEDDVLVTENGYEVLSPNILKSVAEIEAFMKPSK